MTRVSSTPVTVTLTNAQKTFVDQQVERGRYASVSEAVRDGLRALAREEAHLDEWLRAKVRESLDEPGADIPAADVFAELRARNDSLSRPRVAGA